MSGAGPVTTARIQHKSDGHNAASPSDSDELSVPIG